MLACVIGRHSGLGIGRGMAWHKAGTFNVREGVKVTDLSDWITANLSAN